MKTVNLIALINIMMSNQDKTYVNMSSYHIHGNETVLKALKKDFRAKPRLTNKHYNTKQKAIKINRYRYNNQHRPKIP